MHGASLSQAISFLFVMASVAGLIVWWFDRFTARRILFQKLRHQIAEEVRAEQEIYRDGDACMSGWGIDDAETLSPQRQRVPGKRNG